MWSNINVKKYELRLEYNTESVVILEYNIKYGVLSDYFE